MNPSNHVPALHDQGHGTRAEPGEHDRGLLTAGTHVGGYVIEGAIAEGGMGTVYAAAHAVLPRRAAIKVLHRYLLERWSARERLLQEACILEALDHPGLVRVFDVGMLADGRPWIAMELLEGVTLAERLRAQGRLEPLEIVEILRCAVDALGAAHRSGVVHRDLKPENIVILAGDPLAIKLIDWGIAWIDGEPWGRLTLSGLTPGTPFYMSPEQGRGRALDGRSDIYALGVIVCEALCGEPPFRGASPIEIVVQHLTATPPSICSQRPEVPLALDTLTTMMLAKDPADRPSLDQMRAALDGLSSELRDSAEDYHEAVLAMTVEHDDDEVDIVLELPLIGRPRWTPPEGRWDSALERVFFETLEDPIPPPMPLPSPPAPRITPIVPTATRIEVSGEFVSPRQSERRQKGAAELLGLVVSTLLVALMLAGALALPALQLGLAEPLVLMPAPAAAPAVRVDLGELDLSGLPSPSEQIYTQVR